MLKAPHIFSLLFSLLLVFQPALPFVEYALFQDYIAENICVEREVEDSCCKGKCYLEKRIESGNEPVTNDNTPLSINTSFKLLEFEILNPYFPDYCAHIQPIEDYDTKEIYQFLFIFDCFHPPCLI